jgi:hypothetical protein
MASTTEIANLALSHLGVGKDIQALDTDPGQEARACRRFYTEARQTTLRDFNWPFATKEQALALIEEDPTEEWAFSYQTPSDSLKIQRLVSGIRNDTRSTRITFREFNHPSGIRIYTDLDEAIAQYTVDMEDPTFYPTDFKMAFSWRLAMYIAPRITAGDPFQRQKAAAEFYQYEISRAQANSSNGQQDDPEPDGEFQRARS